MFVDELEIYVEAGHGGSGCVSFRREKYVPFGGPDGGQGGDGGSVLIRVKPELNTLLPLRNRRHYRAGKGGNGRGGNRTGATGRSLVLEVPAGTIVRDRETGTIVGDLTRSDDSIVVARGGRGGKGNKHFATATHRAPRFAQPGEPGESLWLKLELKVLADVGLVGFPNAGKSTLIGRISAAKPKIAAYPFTTLEPHLGVVAVNRIESFVVADIPGIIEGAHEGAGLGLRFLKHIERTSLLLILIDPTDPERNPEDNYRALLEELGAYSPKLRAKKTVAAFTKADVGCPREEDLHALMASLEKDGVPCFRISAVRGDGIKDLIYGLNELVKQRRLSDSRVEVDTGEFERSPPPDSGNRPQGPQAADPLDEL